MKAFAVIVGMILTIALCIGIPLCWSHFFPAKYTDSHDVPPGGLAGIFWVFVIYPAVTLFLASISTGFIIEPEMEERSYPALIFYSPGFYFVLFAGMLFFASVFLDSVNSLFINNRASTPAAPGAFWGRFWGCFMPPVILLLWHAASWAGVSLGYKIRSKISSDDD